jgi:predicted transcriptional regulator
VGLNKATKLKLKLARRLKVEKQAIKDLMYGGVREMMNNRLYYYHSSIGREYCRWTEAGEEAMKKFLSDMTKYISEAEEKSLEDRAKKLVLDGLKS